MIDAARPFDLFTFVHEMGHNFGCRHQWIDDDPKTECAYAWENSLGKTILWASDANDIIPFLSNPVIGTGSENGPPAPAKNAQQMSAHGCSVAQYVSSNDWTILIDGPNSACDQNPVTLCAQIEGPSPGSINYSWSWSGSGDFSGNSSPAPVIIGNTQCVTFGSLSCDNFYIQVIATTAQGVLETRYSNKKIKTRGVCPECPYQPRDEPAGLLRKAASNKSSSSDQNRKFSVSVYADQIIKIQNLHPVIEEDVYIDLLSIDGRSIKKFKSNIGQLECLVDLNMSNITSGIYIVRIINGSHEDYQKIFIP